MLLVLGSHFLAKDINLKNISNLSKVTAIKWPFGSKSLLLRIIDDVDVLSGQRDCVCNESIPVPYTWLAFRYLLLNEVKGILLPTLGLCG